MTGQRSNQLSYTPIATVTGGLKKLPPLFEPLAKKMYEKQMCERLFHGDETRWHVFEEILEKILSTGKLDDDTSTELADLIQKAVDRFLKEHPEASVA